MALNTIGSIATHIAENFVLPAGISGNMVETVDCARMDVENYTGNNIGSNNILDKYIPAIKNLAKADALDSAFSWAATYASSGTAEIGGGSSSSYDLKLEGLSVKDETSTQNADALKAISSLSKDSSKQFRELGTMQMKRLGKVIRFARSLS